LPSEINKTITADDNKYNLYLKNRKFSILVEFNFENLFENYTVIKVLTVYNSTNNKYATIVIDD
jgi:hypothetical protein